MFSCVLFTIRPGKIFSADEIFYATKSKAWLADKISSLNAAGKYLLSHISSNGLMSGAGFYMESPPRNQWDGIAQSALLFFDAIKIFVSANEKAFSNNGNGAVGFVS